LIGGEKALVGVGTAGRGRSGVGLALVVFEEVVLPLVLLQL